MIPIVRVLGALSSLLRLFAYVLLVPLPIAWAYDPHDALVLGMRVPSTALVFLGCAALTWILGAALRILARRGPEGMAEREGYLAVAVGGLILPLVAMLPFLWTHTVPRVVPAYFQAMSGLTGTAFNALPHTDATVPSLHAWVAILQWFGAASLIIVGLALLSNLSGSALQLFHADTGTSTQRLRPRLAATGRTILALYGGATLVIFAAMTLLFLHAGLDAKASLYAGFVHALGAFSTGGATTSSGNVAAFHDVWLESGLVVVMLLGATHFSLLAAVRHGRLRDAWRDSEGRFFLGLWAASTIVVVLMLMLHGSPATQALRGGVFTSTSLQTGTGYWNVNTGTWPVAATFPLLVMMFLGGCSGSGAGGLKAFRLMLGAKVVLRQLRLLVHPRAVLPLRMGERTVTESALATATAFLYTYLLAWAFGTLAVAATEPSYSALEAAGASASAIGNVGLAFGPLGPGGSAAHLHESTQLILTGLMWLGRLEIFAALLMFYPSSWRH